MILRAGGGTWCGAVADLRGADADPADVVAAIRGENSPCDVRCARPGEVHRRAGCVRSGTTLRTRTALAAAGRSRGFDAPQDADLERVREVLASFDEEPSVARRPSTAPDVDRDRLRERVAELRGRVRALEARGHDADDERERLRDAARRLSELETERVAAVESRTMDRERRDRRERRLHLEDRRENLARAARSHLVDELRAEFAAAVDSLAPAVDDPFDADPVTAALAVLRVATVRAPVVIAVDRFDSPAAAARWLDAPVIRL